MKQKHKILIVVGIVLLIITGGVIFLNQYLKKEIIEGLENEYPSSNLRYDEISVNVLGGNATIKNIRIKEGIFSLESREINLDDFSYQDYLQNEDITIGSIELLDPEIIFNKSDSTGNDDLSSGEMAERKITVKNFSVSGGNIRVVDNDTASNSLYASLQEINIENLIIQKMDEGTLLPFSYETLDLESDSLFFELNEYHYIQAEHLKLNNGNLALQEISIIPKFSKEVFDQRIPFELDWIALKVDAIELNGLEWDKIDGQVHLSLHSTSIQNAHLEIYRNKLLKDDTRIKPMYSEMLRELDVKIHLDSVVISNSYIEYQEKVLENRPPGKLSFQNVNVEIRDIINKNLDSADFPKTRVEARALFMGETELTLNWDFDVSNQMDEFHVNGSLGTIQAENINPFLVPTMNVEAEGHIESLYYDFYGNRNQASGNMQLEYRDFKVNILKDGEQERKSLLSRLANLIIKNDRVNEDVQQENITTTRDKTKSFWNFLWLLIRDGSLSTFF